ncbi:MAG: DUF1634 domain-containing protein [Bacteroidota bacterium]
MDDTKLYERFIGRILRLGVLLSSLLMASGLIVASLQSSVLPMPERNPTLGELLDQLVSGRLGSLTGSTATTLMFAGLVLLMFTPFLRVITTIVVFRAQRDWTFVAVASLVFLMLAGQVVYYTLL